MNHTFTLDFLSKYRSQLMINSKNKISFSTKVSILSFVLCCGVVSQHVKWTCRDIEWLNALQSFWFFIVETCVPFFFMISGYLFFRTYRVVGGGRNCGHEPSHSWYPICCGMYFMQ